MAPSSMNASLTAMLPTSWTRYQHGCPRRVIDWSMMSSETRKKACSCVVAHVKTRCRDERRGTHQLDTPPQQRRLEILVVRQPPTSQNLHRIDDAQATVEFAAWDVEIEVLHRPHRPYRIDTSPTLRHRHRPTSSTPNHIRSSTSTTTIPKERWGDEPDETTRQPRPAFFPP